jgi:hypothetical protein
VWVEGVLKDSEKPVHPPKRHDLPAPDAPEEPQDSEEKEAETARHELAQEASLEEDLQEDEEGGVEAEPEEDSWEIRKQAEIRARLEGKAKLRPPKADRPLRARKKKPSSKRGGRRKKGDEAPPLLFGPGSRGSNQRSTQGRTDARKGTSGPTRLSSGHWIDPDQMPVQRTTLKMLPGRLEPMDTAVIQQEVRFLSGPGPIHEVTLGWDLGDPPRHVMLDHPSIQPRHAKMTYWDGRWWIESLSEFYPVEVNGESLHLSEKPVPLEDGDLIRLGDAVFRYHKA